MVVSGEYLYHRVPTIDLRKRPSVLELKAYMYDWVVRTPYKLDVILGLE